VGILQIIESLITSTLEKEGGERFLPNLLMTFNQVAEDILNDVLRSLSILDIMISKSTELIIIFDKNLIELFVTHPS
jgi:hypothetical protein